MSEENNIVIMGRTNAGKSTLFNLITGQKNHAIVDATPGTTSDPFITRMEIHQLGKIKLYDTAGIDEVSELGQKRREKTYNCLRESDLEILVIGSKLIKNYKNEGLIFEKEAIDAANKLDKKVLVVINTFENTSEEEVKNALDKIEYKGAYISLNLNNPYSQKELVHFVKSNYIYRQFKTNLLPKLKPESTVILNIPMDDETPEGRLLKPQALILENLIRNYHKVLCYRMNLNNARNKNGHNLEQQEFERFKEIIDANTIDPSKSLIITDSQAMDIVHKWLPKEYPLTTFSIAMINYLSDGKLDKFRTGLNAISKPFEKKDKILIFEACNHDRKGEDIGTIQIPKLLENRWGFKPKIDYAFGRPYVKNIEEYKLVIHCGGCMIDQQKLQARFKELDELGIPYTNYGLLLSYLVSKKALERVLAPWKK